MSKEGMFHFSKFLFVDFHFAVLHCIRAGGIMKPFGEVGENPARVRRRMALLTEHPHPVAASREQAIGAS